MALSGEPDGPPLVAPGAPASFANATAAMIEALTAAHPRTQTVKVDGGHLLGERAAISGLTRRGPVSAGGMCRLVHASDGLLAVNLPRESDLELVPAWLEQGVGDDPWETVVDGCERRRVADLVGRAALLGLAVARVPQPGEVAADDQSVSRHQGFPPEPSKVSITARGAVRGEPGLVVDLSSMWAGPLCAHLLGLAGFEVVKVESLTRPDGARRGPAAFYDLLHAGHHCVALDFGDRSHLAAIEALLDRADVVVESSRPRALGQLGLGPERILPRSPDTVWVSVTGYGRSGPWSNRVAFGDDAAAAAGMVVKGEDGTAMFCGDALADPLAGLAAASAALELWSDGSGGLIDVALRDVVGSTLAAVPVRPDVCHAATIRDGRWWLSGPDGQVPVAEPVARPASEPARPLGADTERILGSLD